MKVVYKYAIEPCVVSKVPSGEIRKVTFQRGALSLWIECDLDRGESEQHVIAVPTGAPFDAMATYVDSAVSDDLVWHVYRGDQHFRLAPSHD